MVPQRVLIIGGGIGGVGLLLGLGRVGIRAQVFERAPQLREVGAGLGVWSGAMRVLDRLGVGKQVRALGLPLARGAMASWRGRPLQSMDLPELLGTDDAACYILHRAEVLAALVAAAPAGQLTTGKTCVGIEQHADRVVALFADGTREEGDLLVGADGLHSVVRANLFGPSPTRYSGQTCYRGIAHVPPPEPQLIREIQGPGKRCALCPLDARRVYWWAAINAPEGEAEPPAVRQARLLREFEGWPFGIVDMLRATPSEAILKNDLVDRAPIAAWSKGRATLLGDAAHPTTPNLGQGACMALEDGLSLARALHEAATLEQALTRYESERVARSARVVRDSWNFGAVARWQSPAAVWARELAMRTTPGFVLKRQVRWHFGSDPGPLVRA